MESQRFFKVGLAVAIVAAMMLTAFGGMNFTKAQNEESSIGLVYLKNGVGQSLLDKLDIEIIESFDEFQLVWLTPSKVAALESQGIESGIIGDRTVISMNTYTFDTTLGDPAIPESMKASDSCSLYILQFIGPVKTSWVEEAKAVGIEFHNYIPYNAYLVRGSVGAIEEARGLFSVQWAGQFHPAYKFKPEIVSGPIRVTIWNGPDVDQTLDAISALCPEAEFSYDSTSDNYETIMTVDSSLFDDLARLDDVIWMEQLDENILYDETSSEIIGGIWTANTPYGAAGNYANIAGWDGTNVVVAIADTGLGNGAAGNANHVDFNTNRVLTGKDYTSSGTWHDGYGHGTHCAGIISANGWAGTGVKYGSTNYYCGAGVAPDSKLYAQKIFTDGGSGTGIPTTAAGWNTFFQDAYNAGSYVHSNSWGENPGDSAYEANDIYYDQHVRDSASSTTGQQPLIITVAAGNAGSGAGTIGSPASGKNVIAVGATENYHTDANTYGDLYDAVPADVNDPSQIISFSSRGLDDDTKVKPDICAPGVGIVSTHSTSAGNNLYGYYSPDHRYEWCSGTSQANPHVAGAAAVIVDWWQAGHSGTYPMPAMVKALLINTATDIGTADIPNGNEGWGRAYLPTIVNPSVNVLNYDNPQQLSTGQTYTKQVTYDQITQPMKITLVYTDAPGVALSNPTLVNNLNLRVTAPGGQIWYGNAFSGGYSVSGTGHCGNTNINGENWDRNSDSWDDVNNVECVYIPTGQLQAGTYTIEVIGYNVPTDVITGGAVDQDFGITIYNANDIAAGATATATGPVGGPTNVASITLTYTYTGTPTSVNIYRTTNGGASWTLCGNDASVNGNYAYTITSGSGTYGWLASAVGGGSTESSPPPAGTPPEAASYIFDNVAPTITATTFADGANGVVITAGTYDADFSEDMNAVGSVATNLPGATYSWVDANTYRITYSALAYSTTYTTTYQTTFTDLAGNALGGDRVKTFTTEAPPPAAATATGPISAATNVVAITITYSYVGTPTSVNLYRTTNGGASWALCGNDASVNGNYAYTIVSGSGTYGWIASAVGGGSTESSPPAPGTPPEATSYILDLTPPAAPTGLTVEHWGYSGGTTPVVEGFQASGSATTSTNLVLTAPAGIQVGELLLLIVENDYNQAVTEFNPVTGWTKIGEAGSNTPDAFIGAYWRIADGTEGASVTVTSNNARAWLGWYIRISGADTTTPINVQNFAMSTGTGVNPHVIPQVTTTVDSCLTIYGLSFDGGDSGTMSVAGAGWTESDDLAYGTTTAGVSGSWGTKIQATAGGTGTASVTTAVLDGASYFQLAIQPASGTPTLDDNTLNWTHSGADVSQYVIYRSDVSTGPWDVAHIIDYVPVGTNTYCDLGKGQADAVLWWYVVRAEDALGNRETNGNSVQEPGMIPYSISLTGKSTNSWVFVSFPSEMSGNIQTILNDAALGDGGTTWTVAKWCTPQDVKDPWKTYRVGSSINDMPTLTNQMGVWLWITTNGGDQALTLNAYAANPASAVNINLYTGWNMVGYPSGTSRLASVTLPGVADYVSVWQAASPYLVDYSNKALVTMSHGNAYWVHVTADCIWVVNP